MRSGKAILKPDSHLYLTGFMGAGKSTVGRELAKVLGRRFYDTDALIEARTGKSVRQIFEEDGEARFRELESEVVADVARKRGAVVALGGGAILRPDNWQRITDSGVVVYLKWPFEALWQRIGNDAARPLTGGGRDPRSRDRLNKLWQEREPYYARADVTVLCDSGMAADTIIRKITQRLAEQA